MQLTKAAAAETRLHRCVAATMRRMMALEAEREKAWKPLWGRPTKLKVHILRMAVLAFDESITLHVGDFLRECAHLASSRTIRTNVHELVERGALIAVPAPYDFRARMMLPTEELVRFFNEQTLLVLGHDLVAAFNRQAA